MGRAKTSTARKQKRPEPTQWQLGLKPGDTVDYINDDGKAERRKVRSEPWQLGHGEWVIKLDGRTGGVMLTRCKPQDFDLIDEFEVSKRESEGE